MTAKRSAVLHVARDDEPRAPREADELRHSEDLARVVRFIEKLQRAGLYGKVEIGFQAGKVTALHLGQTLKIDEL